MKIYRKIMILVVALLVSMSVNVNAADYATEPSIDATPTAEMTLTPSATEAKKGETVTVTISAKCESGIEAVDATLEFDATKLELITELEYMGSNGYISFSEELETGKVRLSVAYNREGTLTEADFSKLQFKVLSEESTKIKLTGIELADVDENYINLNDKEININLKEETPGGDEKITLSSIAVTSNATKLSYKAGEKFDKTGMVIKATYSDGTSKVITDYTYTPNGELSVKDTVITISYKEGDVTKTVTQAITVKAIKQEEPKNPTTDDNSNDGSKKDNNKPVVDNTIANKPINNAGIEENAFALILIIAVVIALYIKNKEYNDIK